ncbi:transcriptional regulator, putative [Methanocaldococcus jannaschii DSM 2661]|uniref:HTH-type transcriptional regulator Ptr1 n=1 Tax=Methanocaldococcus jannaschii (strain ATCC 43067 / DSM 2661 / JAL-1 / JCM 10045 / NBRC 100440) TaxID=243232 RepID=PTR1_METJA|nr:HTH-type transcriptional regulator Ptr1 [Methanocaldococcus jannaschii]Q57615.1 RecName: Full=HTH-type transcriptional regulator Ptr1 [Methanocaldococcus jannaschii DSM 2661]AAB98133.1 transcriptional regulator, putative [Methanocaldococcus jannaschii DSM 2661]
MLDRIDLKILRILNGNARKSFREIGRELGISEGTVRNRVKRLTEKGIITGFHASINPKNLGFEVVAILGLYIKPSKVEETLNKLKELDEIVELYQTTGEYDAVCIAILKDIESLGKFLAEKIYPLVNVNGCKVTLVLRTFKDGSKMPI